MKQKDVKLNLLVGIICLHSSLSFLKHSRSVEYQKRVSLFYLVTPTLAYNGLMLAYAGYLAMSENNPRTA